MNSNSNELTKILMNVRRVSTTAPRALNAQTLKEALLAVAPLASKPVQSMKTETPRSVKTLTNVLLVSLIVQ